MLHAHAHTLTPRPFTAVAWQRGRVSNPCREQWPVMSQLLLTSRSERGWETEEERRKFKLEEEGGRKISGLMMRGFDKNNIIIIKRQRRWI